MEKPEGKKPLERPRRRWENSIKMDLQQVVSGSRAELTRLRTGIGGE